jgi:ADP-heptose:LPS heptosyltransferase
VSSGQSADRKHVLVVRLGGSGGVLLSGPAVRAVSMGASRVTYLCSTRGEEAARMLPGVDDVEVFDAPWEGPECRPVKRAELLSLLNRVAWLGVDDALILTSDGECSLAMAMLLRMVGVPRIAAVTDSPSGALLDVALTRNGLAHEAERNLALVQAAGYDLSPDDDGRLAVRLPEPEQPLPELPAGPYVVLHPGASAPSRTWAADRHHSAARALVDDGWSVVVTGSKAERAVTSMVAGYDGLPLYDFGGLTDLAGLARVLAGASAVVTGQTATLHLAAAVGAPVVAIHPPVERGDRWQPWGVPHVLLGQQDIGCAGCRTTVCPLEAQPCLATVSEDEVVRAVSLLAPPFDLRDLRVPA